MNRTSDRAYNALVGAVEDFKDAMIAEVDDILDDLERANKKINEFDQENTKLIEERDELRNQIQILESNITDLHSEIIDLQREIDNLIDQLK